MKAFTIVMKEGTADGFHGFNSEGDWVRASFGGNGNYNLVGGRENDKVRYEAWKPTLGEALGAAVGMLTNERVA